MVELGQLTVATFCEQCGFVQGTPAGEGVNRCGECGCYASSDSVCCTVHELRESPYRSGECPYCEEEQRVKEQRIHEATRDPTLEPW